MKKILLEIQNEDKKNPYTDKELSEILGISRGDIVQFRKINNIPNSRDRRKELLENELLDILGDNTNITERKITEILIERGFDISRSAVSKILKSDEIKNRIYNHSSKNSETIEGNNSKKEINVENVLKINNSTEKENDFEMLIGYKGSLKEKINLAKSAIVYPPNGLHTMIYGETGVGKSELANCMYKYAVRTGIKEKESPFIVFNCADYAENPNMLMSQLFGSIKGAYTGASENREGLVEKADGGVLFLDEIHRLPASGQEILFSLIDRGEFRRLGETNNTRKANVLIIAATTEDPDSNLLDTFRRRIPMVITLPNLDSRPKLERYDIIIKFFEREAIRINKNIIITKEVLYGFMNYKCKSNIGQLKSDIQVSCARAFSKNPDSSDKLIIDVDSLRTYIKESIKDNEDNLEFSFDRVNLEDTYIDINEINSNKMCLSEENIDEIYKYAEKELKVLESRQYSQEEIKNIFFERLDRKFNQIKKNNIKENRKKIHIMSENLNPETINIMNKVITVIKNQYRFVNNGLYMVLATHIEEAIKRVRNEKNIINPSLDNIKENMSEEYDLARYVVTIIENIAKISLPEDEIGYIAYYIYKFCMNEETMDKKVKVVIVTHGKVGIEMSKVVNQILGTMSTYGIEFPMDMPPQKGIEKVMQDIKALDFKNDILMLIDMGSLVILGEKIEEELGLRCRVINRVDTILAMEAGKSAVIEGKNLDKIVEDLKKNKYYSIVSNKNYKSKDINKKDLVLTLCLSGRGTALSLKNRIEQKLLKENIESIEVKALGVIDDQKIEEKIKELEKEYRIIAICGTLETEINDIPFIPYTDILKGNGIDKVIQYSKYEKEEEKENKLENLIYEELILDDVEGVSKEYIIDTLVAKLEDGEYVDSKYILSLYKREAMGGAVLGGKVAIPHGLPEHVIKPAIAIAKLNKPIVWDNEFMVEAVVLIAIKENNKIEIKELFKKLSDENFLDELKNTKNKTDIAMLFY
ncbi:sigma 54-interacting transcriptional regulator [Peptacetobacter hiranonis]|uniref:Sigma-54 interaction domain protein n=1 Tax=Peptacetobacter hiranonis (strain DSM 13275 / JCM 10541 / KCTC 15199 / TO-931) TaxID=500633 RepID=B6FWC4_PEPHT|nr:sigma 54-interacting transcriptional regulator [Peptacetobacter hiranonis]EEA86163.1 Sigma-54 interaction domain protein [Peptacetobacter hiranonis DSM 13275]QEK21282.1 Transcriptional regulatory protein DagR [Peptacetobacter hiranonis]